MLNEHLAQLWTNIHSIEHASIRLFESDAISSQESVLIKNGFFMMCGLTLEKASAVLDESNYKSTNGHLRSLVPIVLLHQEGFSSFLSMLDEVDDIISNTISAVDSRFKAESLLMELHRCLVGWSPHLWRTVCPLFTNLLKGELTSGTVSFLRQWCNLLSKIHISREDLLVEGTSEYHYSEFLSFAETSVQRTRDNEYWDLILRIRLVLHDVISSFSMNVPRPKHGPGAVANPKVKTLVEKYLDMGFDSRIDYMLRKDSGEEMRIYSPFPLGGVDRTSRVIFVPKTWKKLRGISAEPSSLQFFQQAVLSSLVESISKTDLRHVINLHDQEKSRLMALKGSRDGSLATIDLSAASDSVTLQLVKDIFGTSDLCRWLLATRSTHTLIDHQRLEIFKFAPMGSACCFPVECLVFAGISLAVAAKRSKGKVNYHSFRVFGDDIICPSHLAEDIMQALTLCGFSVNTDKSYWVGDYRESCGMDAWRGTDVTPLKLKDFSFDFDGTYPLSYEHHSRCISYFNYLYHHGFHKLRSFFLKKLLNSRIRMRGESIEACRSLVFGDGSRGTCSSRQPDNFHLQRLPLMGYQRYGLKVAYWKPRYRKLPKQVEELVDEVNYFERQLFLRTSAEGSPIVYDLVTYFSEERKASLGVRIGLQMIPSWGYRDEWYPSEERSESKLFKGVQHHRLLRRGVPFR